MAKTRYSFEKRQKEIARRKKQEDKIARRTETKQHLSDAVPVPASDADAGEASQENSDRMSQDAKDSL